MVAEGIVMMGVVVVHKNVKIVSRMEVVKLVVIDVLHAPKIVIGAK